MKKTISTDKIGTKNERELADLRINKFRDNISQGKCPFCNKELEWYDGALGYEASRCYECKFTIDHSRMHFDEEYTGTSTSNSKCEPVSKSK